MNHVFRFFALVLAFSLLVFPLLADKPRPGPKPPKPWPPPTPEYATYQCDNDAGCDAEITEDGKIVIVHFRDGDLASTEGGYRFDTDDGWVCIDP